MSKIAVYCMPGLAASSRIFEFIDLDAERFELVLLEWLMPTMGESLKDYARRMCEQITHDQPVLIGVSFGGILVQEMAQLMPVRKVIIVSSVKSRHELPRRMHWARQTKAYRFVPLGWVNSIENLMPFTLGRTVRNRIKLYQRYLSVRNPKYLRWGIQQVVEWDREESDPRVIHIHGDRDEVFPIKYISQSIVVAEGTHVMIINRFRWFNENLPRLIDG